MKYSYTRSIFPPALVIPIVIEDKDRMNSMVIDSKIDTGADITTIPENVIMALNLKPDNLVDVRGPFDDYKVVPTYLIIVKLEDGREFRLKVVPNKKGIMLLGRDALNGVILTANGPKQVFTID
jgi:predicted aspartyl protease